MRAIIAAAALLLFAAPVQASRNCDLEKVHDEIRWCLIEAPQDIKGRDQMVTALQSEGTATDLFHFRIGYADCHDRDREKLRNFLECRRDDPTALLNFGRQLIDLPPLANGS